MNQQVVNNKIKIGVVIPAWNEAQQIKDCLDSLKPFRDAGDTVIVVDAASDDITSEVANAAGADVIRIAEKYRGTAVAAGYDSICNKIDVVLIAHADMRYPANARESICKALTENPNAVGGVLGHKINETGFRFRVVEMGNRFRACCLQIPYGDQAMFIRKSAIAMLTEFPHQNCLEDIELAISLKQYGRWLFLNCPVEIDSRHWRKGVIKTTLRNWCIAINYATGRREVAIHAATATR